MSDNSPEVWISGIGIISSLGEGVKGHWDALTGVNMPQAVVDTDSMAPFPIHPTIKYDIASQIPKRSDQRQMGPWQHLGTYSAGLALDDAGIAGDADLLARTNLIVAAGGGKRDYEVDTAILENLSGTNNYGPKLNGTLSDELRPTLFLAQLSNLLAGNISIVHGVTDSSRSFVGESMAGVSAVDTASKQIQAGQGDIFLVGGAYISERPDMMLQFELGGDLWAGKHGPVWSRRGTDGGMIMGSAGAFLVLESSVHAKARGARPYAKINRIAADRCNRKLGAALQNAKGLLAGFDDLQTGQLPVLSATCGIEPYLSEEHDFLTGLADQGMAPSIRGFSTLFGNTMEAQFPLAVALAAMAVSKATFYPPFDTTGIETATEDAVERVMISNWGHWRGESLTLIDTPDTALREVE